ncbi:MAG: sulfite exporter TauE/SafE family protein [Candidatus Saccharimonas sp.]
MTKHKSSRRDRLMHRDDNLQQHMIEKTVPIKGMHCASCELLITEELESIPGVASAQASLKSNSATIMSAEQVSDKDIESAVQAAGYEVGYESEQRPFFSHNERVWKDFAIGIIVVLGLYVLFQVFGIEKLTASTTTSSSTGTMALLVGLTAGFSTCMALIGGLVISVASKYAENHPTETALQKFRPHLFFNAGRIASFIAFGAIIGAIGSAFALKGSLLGFLTIAVGMVMLILGLQLTEIFPRITRGLTLPSGLARKLGINNRKEREYSHKNAFLMGAATFFLPCGFTQAMQLLAVSTGNPLQAAVIMGAFAIGTTPGLLTLGGLTSVVKGVFAQRFFRIVGVIVVAMALINFTNGYTLAGLDRFLDSSKPMVNTAVQKQSSEGSVILNTTFKLKEDIIPSKFTAKVGQKTTLVVDVKEDGQGCMSTIMIIGLDDNPQYLKKGKKIELTFTATKPGTYTIACAMGVPRGSITVTE